MIVNSICPGLVHTDIGHAIASRSWLLKFGVPLYLLILGKTSDHGARTYVNAALKPESDHVSNTHILFNIDGLN